MIRGRKRILIVTQKVDRHDAVLGFFHTWIEQFARHFSEVRVICLEKGSVHLPENVKVFSLGKEEVQSRVQYMKRFFRYITHERKNYDVVFVHMNPVYAILGGLLWRMWHKRMYLWYTHKHVDLKLRMAEKLVDNIFTASKESFRLPSKKVEIVGHGIDTEIFKPKDVAGDSVSRDVVRILSVGRVSRTKNQHRMIESVQKMHGRGRRVELVIAGAGITAEDVEYEKEIREYVVEHGLVGSVIFLGNIQPEHIVEQYQASDVFINLSETGSLDKAVLEAMSCGLRVLTSNEAFRHVLPADAFFSREDLTPEVIAEKIETLMNSKPDGSLRTYVVENHNIKNLIPYISGVMSLS